jgi:hypothetical protein
MELPDAEPTPQLPGGVYAQLTALAGHVARLQARVDEQEALLLDLRARVDRLVPPDPTEETPPGITRVWGPE